MCPLTTPIGVFDGTSWETLMQRVFKYKYINEGYQRVPATPGDFGIEGFTQDTGKVFQCYCPDSNYTQQELYEHQRDKINTDLNKLKINERVLGKILGKTKISKWIFATPLINKNDILKYIQNKTNEVLTWNLSIVSTCFLIQIHDIDDYFQEINTIQKADGEHLTISNRNRPLPTLDKDQEEYEQNILRKTQKRISKNGNSSDISSRTDRLYNSTYDSFARSDSFFRQIEATNPPAYQKIVNIIISYGKSVSEDSQTWCGTPQELTDRVKNGLIERLRQDFNGALSSSDIEDIANHTISRWIANCDLDYTH